MSLAGYLSARSGDGNTVLLKHLAVSLEPSTSEASKSVACATRFEAPEHFRHTVGLQNGVLITGVKKRHSTVQSKLLNHQKTPQNVFSAIQKEQILCIIFRKKALLQVIIPSWVFKWDEDRKCQARLMRLLNQSDRSLLSLVVLQHCLRLHA